MHIHITELLVIQPGDISLRAGHKSGPDRRLRPLGVDLY